MKNQFMPSLITVNLMLIRDTLNQKMVGYHGNRDFIDRVRSLFKSTRSLIQSMNSQVSTDSNYSSDDRDDCGTMFKTSLFLLDSWETELNNFEKEWEAKVKFDNKMYMNGR